jgi:hypothetical protein
VINQQGTSFDRCGLLKGKKTEKKDKPQRTETWRERKKGGRGVAGGVYGGTSSTKAST